MKKKTKVVIGLGIVLLGLWMSITAMEDFLNPIKFVNEVTTNPEEYLNRNVQVAGLIMKESVEKGIEPNSYIFNLTDGKGILKVEYSGSAPVPEVAPGVGVTVIGVYTLNNRLISNKILLKCPSKYQEELIKNDYRNNQQSKVGT